jgi:hypothetical protein
MQRIDNYSDDMKLIITMLINGDYQSMVSQLKSSLEMGMTLETEFELQRSDFLRLMYDYRAIHTDTISDQDVKKMIDTLFNHKRAIQVDMNFMVALFDKQAVFKIYYNVAINDTKSIAHYVHDADVEESQPSAPAYELLFPALPNQTIIPTAPPVEDNSFDQANLTYKGMRSSILFPNVFNSNDAAKGKIIEPDDQITLCIVGGKGSGKTELFKQCVSEQDNNTFLNGPVNVGRTYYQMADKCWQVNVRDMPFNTINCELNEYAYFTKSDGYMNLPHTCRH